MNWQTTVLHSKRTTPAGYCTWRTQIFNTAIPFLPLRPLGVAYRLVADSASLTTIWHLMTTLIIGYGSTLRRDDGVGFLVAEHLMDLLPEGSVIARQQLTPDLADDVSQAKRVIFIDACAKTAPGEIRTEEVRPAGEDWGAFVHEMSPGVLLDCVKQVYEKVPAAQLITIGGEDFAIGEGLTAPVAQAMQTVIEQVLATCRVQ